MWVTLLTTNTVLSKILTFSFTLSLISNSHLSTLSVRIDAPVPYIILRVYYKIHYTPH